MASSPQECGFDDGDGLTTNLNGNEQSSANRAFYVNDEDPKRSTSITDRAVRFLSERSSESPFFLQVSYYAVHLDVVCTAESEEHFREKGSPDREYTPAWAGMLYELDQNIGRLLKALEDQGLRDNTYVFFTSDNGGSKKIPGASAARPTNYPLRGAKQTLYEGGIRVPFIVCGPGIVPGSVDHTPVVGYDFLPTFYALAGGTVPLPDEIDGKDLSSLWAGDRLPERALFFHRPRHQTSAIRSGDYKLWFRWNSQGRVEERSLYKVGAEAPLESVDLSSAHPETVAELEAEMLEYLDRVDAETVGDYQVVSYRRQAAYGVLGGVLFLCVGFLCFLRIAPRHSLSRFCFRVGGKCRATLEKALIPPADPSDIAVSAGQNRGYRRDIDGLRAIAVIPVVLFHFHLGFPGGFIGVDVFFVISGYLIAGILHRDLTDQKFSLFRFWERRVRRLLPALTAVVITTAAVGLLILGPNDLNLLAKSIISQSMMLANVYFWRTTDYFSPSIDTQPLAHLWSLAVEEQFYLVLPLLLIVLYRFRNITATRWVLGSLAVLSFVLSAQWVTQSPTAAFYLLPTRAWELLVGVLLALSPWTLRSAFWRETFSALGLAAILIASVTFSADMTFPGPIAGIPCLGAAAILWANSRRLTFTGRLLSNRPLVFVGLISYSLYLWHWPISAFATYIELGDSLMWQVTLMGISLLAAWVSWRWIEQPCRTGFKFAPRPAVLACGVVVLIITAGFAAIGWVTKGLPQRFSPTTLAYFEGQRDFFFTDNVSPADISSDNLVAVSGHTDDEEIYCLVWGDSHAKATLGTFQTLGDKHGKRVVAAVHSATAPIENYVCTAPASLKTQSPAFCKNVVDYVHRHRVQHVVLIARWSGYWPRQTDTRMAQLLAATIADIQSTGAQVWLMKEVPEFPYAVPRMLAVTHILEGSTESIFVDSANHRERVRHVASDLAPLGEKKVHLLDPAPYLFDVEGHLAGAENGRVIYKDQHHLTTVGAAKLTEMFEPIFETTVARLPDASDYRR